MTDYLREIEESMRTEKWWHLWQEYKTLIICGCLALIIGTAAQTAWTSWQTAKNESLSARILEAQKTPEPAAALFAILSEQSQPTVGLAGLMAANTFAKEKAWDKAIKAYKKTAEKKEAPPLLRDLARVQMVALQMDHGGKDITPDSLLADLAPIIADKKSAWQSYAVLLSAVIKANIKQDYTAALADLALAERQTDLPAAVIEQVKALKSVYLARSNDMKKEK